MKAWMVLPLIAASAISACKSNDTPEVGSTPSSTAIAGQPAPWEPVDEDFRGCEGGWGERMVGGSADIVVQPGAKDGDRTYCPMSGVVFQVKKSSSHREVDGKPIYFCCETCADYFMKHRDRIAAARGLARSAAKDWSGSLAISDVVATGEMPPALATSLEALTGCVAGAARVDELSRLLADAGFEDVKIEIRPGSGDIIGRCMPGAEDYVASATIEGRKPGASCCAPSCCATGGPFA